VATTEIGAVQGCQMANFQTKNPIRVNFCRVLQWKVLVYYMSFGSILRLFGIFCGHMVYFVVIWNFYPFWYVATKKTGNPGVV
jgi:hypothetical protein